MKYNCYSDLNHAEQKYSQLQIMLNSKWKWLNTTKKYWNQVDNN